jgi:PHP family Zn ribbon phosphoesterase
VVYSHLGGVNEPEVFGMQVVANAEDEVEGFQERLLIGATDISIDDIVRTIHAHEGLAIAAHIDRESFGIIGQLGFIPDVLPFDGLEISQLTSDEAAAARFPEYRSYPWTRSSDAHTLDRIGSCTSRFLIAEPTFGEICDALHNRSGRAVATAGA